MMFSLQDFRGNSVTDKSAGSRHNGDTHHFMEKPAAKGTASIRIFPNPVQSLQERPNFCRMTADDRNVSCRPIRRMFWLLLLRFCRSIAVTRNVGHKNAIWLSK
jgi:hypothetical protein